MEIDLSTILALIGILTAVASVFGAWGRINTITAVQNEQIRNIKSEQAQASLEIEKYKDRVDHKISSLYSKVDEHYQKLDSKIDGLQKLIIEKIN